MYAVWVEKCPEYLPPLSIRGTGFRSRLGLGLGLGYMSCLVTFGPFVQSQFFCPCCMCTTMLR
jgi:hypothetical protein